MKLSTKLEDVYTAVSKCLRCSMCTYSEWPDNYTICPMYLYDKCFAYSGGGLMYIAKSLIDKQLNFDSKVSDLLYTCSGCLACDDICEIIPNSEPYVRPFDIIRLMRYEAVKRGLVSDGRMRDIQEQIQKYEEIISSKKENTLGIPKKIYNNNADKILFVEWSFLTSQQKIYHSVLRVLEKIGEPIAGISDGGLNLPDLYDLGYWEQMEDFLATKFDIKGLKGKEIIFINPHSQEFFVHRFSEIISGYENIKSWHISEFILDALQKGKLRMKKRSKQIKVSYHDPCYLGRGLGIYDPPREILSLIDGVDLVEMERNRRNSFCCGARARDYYFQDFSKKTTLERLNEFKKTGADLMLTACPYCQVIFQKMMPDTKNIVKDLTEFIDETTE